VIAVKSGKSGKLGILSPPPLELLELEELLDDDDASGGVIGNEGTGSTAAAGGTAGGVALAISPIVFGGGEAIVGISIGAATSPA
jgi:hypothetical protein